MKVAVIVAVFTSCLTAVFAADAAESSGSCIVLGATSESLGWDYGKFSGKGPSHWHEGNKECAGQKQSPIDWPSEVVVAPSNLGPKPVLGNATFKLVPTNQNFALACAAPGSCGHSMIDGQKYVAANLHFHAPSEHSLAGRFYPLEAHIVHVSPDGTKYAVIAVMFDYPPDGGYASTVYEQSETKEFGVNELTKMVLAAAQGGVSELSIPLGSIVQADKGFCSYKGSLTTPPCTEAVTFYMSLNTVSVTKRQVHSYLVAAGAGVEGNARPLQQRNGRNVTCYLGKPQ